MEEDFEDSNIDLELEEAILSSLEKGEREGKTNTYPKILPIFPMLRRPFFPGMASPLMIEPGPFYEALKQIAKTEDQCVGLVLSLTEEGDIYKLKFKDLHKVGVQARILRIIPMENNSAQVILNMEKRIKIVKPINDPKILKAEVAYPESTEVLNDELKAYAISIISTIKELLKLNPLFKEELQIFLGPFRFYRTGKTSRFCRCLNNSLARRASRCSGNFRYPKPHRQRLLSS